MSVDHSGTQTAPASSQGKGGWIALGLITATLLGIATVSVVHRAVDENRLEGDAGDPTADAAAVAARMQNLRIMAEIAPDKTMPELEQVLETGTIPERQAAFAILGDLKNPHSDEDLSRWLDLVNSSKLPPEVRLDLVEAAAKHDKPEIKAKLAALDAARPKDDPLAPYHDALTGGNADRGRSIFLEKAEAQCVRCHKMDGSGGEVGPELTGVGSRHPREYILESIILPNKQIAKNFEGITLAIDDGTIVSGVLKGEDDKDVKVMTAEGKLLAVPKDTIEERKVGGSAMPADLYKSLSKLEIRDLVEFLSQSKEVKKVAKTEAKAS